MIVKAITLTEPWASLVVSGAKQIETRSWRTNYTGLLAIHAAKTMPVYAIDACRENFIKKALQEIGIVGNSSSALKQQFHLGCVIGLVRLSTIIEIKGYRQIFKGIKIPPDNPELAFGDYTPGRFAWIFTPPIVRIPDPIPCRGALGLWNFEQNERLTTLAEFHDSTGEWKQLLFGDK